ncbi:MAG: PIN domain-containing protein [Dehalococcoidia bacterium]|nr:PIN domain-containing protein [Dehalococcoidia bacterium]
MRIVLDSSVICSDFQFGGTLMTALLAGLSTGHHSLYVPAIVLDEVKTIYAEQLRQVSQTMKKAQSHYQRVTGRVLEPQVDEQEMKRLADEYEKHLHQTLASVDAIVLPYPDATHEALTKRALQQEKPFSAHDGGYRDALIWEAVIALAQQEGRPVAFVTGNTKDFADINEQMHPDLRSDLEGRGIPRERVQFYPSLERFIDEVVRPALENVTEEEVLQSARQGALLGDALGSKLANRLSEAHDELDNHRMELGIPYDAEEVTVYHVEDLQDLAVTDARRLSQGRFLIDLEADTTITVDFSLFKADYWVMDEREMADFEVWDSDWSKHYIWAAAIRDVRIEVAFVLDVTKQQIDSVEIVGFSEAGPARA